MTKKDIVVRIKRLIAREEERTKSGYGSTGIEALQELLDELETVQLSTQEKETHMKEQKPEVTRMGALDMQVCVPEGWTDEQVKVFADSENLCGTENGWVIRKQGSELLAGADERVRCTSRDGFVHVMLDA